MDKTQSYNHWMEEEKKKESASGKRKADLSDPTAIVVDEEIQGLDAGVSAGDGDMLSVMCVNEDDPNGTPVVLEMHRDVAMQIPGLRMQLMGDPRKPQVRVKTPDVQSVQTVIGYFESYRHREIPTYPTNEPLPSTKFDDLKGVTDIERKFTPDGMTVKTMDELLLLLYVCNHLDPMGPLTAWCKVRLALVFANTKAGGFRLRELLRIPVDMKLTREQEQAIIAKHCECFTWCRPPPIPEYPPAPTQDNVVVKTPAVSSSASSSSSSSVSNPNTVADSKMEVVEAAE